MDKKVSMLEQYIPLLSGLVFVGLFLLSFVGFYIKSKKDTGLIIADDVAQLKIILEKIHATCKIIDFDYQKNWINFLNVASFEGSEVGNMNLAYPEKWEGPYLKDNPTIQEKEYMVVKTDKGYFITPGEGVRLPNGKKIGSDILLDINTDIQQLIQGGVLAYKQKPLATTLILTQPVYNDIELSADL